MDDMRLREIVSDADKLYETEPNLFHKNDGGRFGQPDGVYFIEAARMLNQIEKDPRWHQLWPVAYALQEESEEALKTSR